MPVNRHIRPQHTGEQSLHEDLLIEAIKFYGHDVSYIPRRILEVDDVLGEIHHSSFKEAVPIEMYLETVDGYDGDGHLFGKFGLEIRNQIRLVVSKSRWRSSTENNDTVLDRPAEGDLIYFKMVNSLFEIKYVDGDSPFFQLEHMPVFKLTCELFEYNSEKFDTGDDDVDAFNIAYGDQIRVTLSDVVGNFYEGETVTATDSEGTTTAIYSLKTVPVTAGNDTFLFDEDEDDFVPTTTAVVLILEEGDKKFATGDEIVGSDSGATATIASITPSLSHVDDDDPAGDNAAIESYADEIIDFSEDNPFGEP